MKMNKPSLLLSFIDKFDIKEESFQKVLSSSFFMTSLKKFFSWTQKISDNFASKSLFIKHLDFLILALISILIISITFMPTTIIGIFAITVFFLVIIKLLFKKDTKLELKSLFVPILLYFAIAVISVGFSSLFIPSLKGFAKMAVYFCSFFAFFIFLKDNPRKSLYLLGLLALTASFESIYAILQNFINLESLATWQDKTNANPEQLMNRVYGSLQPLNPNLLAGYLVASLPAVLGLSFLSLYKKNIFRSLLCFGGVFSVLIAIMFTGSRGSYLAIAAIALAFVLISGHIIWQDFKTKSNLKRLWIWSIIIGLFVVISLIICSPSLQYRIASIFSFREDSSNSFRFNVYASSFKMFLDNWIIGIGPGNNTFRLIYGLYMRSGFDALGAYSVPLEIAVESGIFALLSFVWFLGLSFIKGVKNIISNNAIEDKIIVSTVLLSIVGIMTHGIVDTIWYRPQVQIIFWLYIAILAVIVDKNVSKA